MSTFLFSYLSPLASLRNLCFLLTQLFLALGHTVPVTVLLVPPATSVYFACKEGSEDAGMYIIRVNFDPEIVVVAKPTHVVHFSLAYASAKIAV